MDKNIKIYQYNEESVYYCSAVYLKSLFSIELLWEKTYNCLLFGKSLALR